MQCTTRVDSSPLLAAVKLAIELYSEVLVAVDDFKYVALKEERNCS
jgi:hypothetical protein